MDESETELVKKLKSNNPDKTYDALVQIRKRYTKDPEKLKQLQEHSFVETIIPFLEHPKFCNITSSVVADICLDKSLVYHVIKCNGLSSLIRIMRISINEEVQNRACRALGNIAKTSVGQAALLEVNPTPDVMLFLKETKNKNCQLTGIRSLGILCRVQEHREFIITEKGFAILADLLSTGDETIVLYCCKTLSELTENCSKEGAENLLETRLVHCLVGLFSKSDSTCQFHIIKTLKNAVVHEEFRSEFTRVGAVKLFADSAMSSAGIHSVATSQLAAVALCSSLDHMHMWNNYGLPKSVGWKALLECLKYEAFSNIHQHIIDSLMRFCYDLDASRTLLNLGLVPLLLDKLAKFIRKRRTVHTSPVAQKINKNFVSPLAKNKTVKKHRIESSTGGKSPSGSYSSGISSDSGYPQSPSSSNCSSSNFQPSDNYESSGLSYSVLKSSDSPFNFVESKHSNIAIPPETQFESFSARMQEEAINLSVFRPIPMPLENCLDGSDFRENRDLKRKLSSNSQAIVKKSMDNSVLGFLTQVYYFVKVDTGTILATYTHFSILLDYIELDDPLPAAEILLANALELPECFENFVASGCIAELFNRLLTLHPWLSCERCHKMQTSIERLHKTVIRLCDSDYAVGTLYRVFSTSKDEDVQLHALQAISKLVTRRSMLFPLLFESPATPVLWRLVADDSNETKNTRAMQALCALYSRLQVGSGVFMEFEDALFDSTPCLYSNSNLDVSFAVDGVLVSASRDKICESSEYFNALLEGHFCEKDKSVVVMHCASAEILTAIFHYLQGCCTTERDTSDVIHRQCEWLKSLSSHDLLGLLAECEKLLLFDFKKFVEDRLKLLLKCDMASKMYQTAKANNSISLADKVLNFLLMEPYIPLIRKMMFIEKCMSVLDLKDFLNRNCFSKAQG